MVVSAQSLHAALSTLVTCEVRLATDADAVAGVQPRVVVEPTSEQDVAQTLAFANRTGLKVLPRGGGTQLGLGFPPSAGDILLSMTRLDRVEEHAPHDQTVTVQAGLRLVDLQTALAQTRQWLALDPVLSEAATIGGLVATNASGARRLRYGGVRDQIIGVRVVLPDGTIARGGGKVVKNVAGYDLPKLFTGSLGTLGVIVAATFRLYPLPGAVRTLVLQADSPAPLGELVARVAGSTLVPAALDLLSPAAPGGAHLLAARFDAGTEAAALHQVGVLTKLAGELAANAELLHDDAQERFWREAHAHLAQGASAEAEVLLKASVVPAEVVRWLERLAGTAERMGLDTRWRAHAGHGLIFARICGAEAALATAVEELRAAATAGQGSLVVQDVAPALAQRLDVWGPSAALAVMRRLKARFDPLATLNPGRFVGRI